MDIDELKTFVEVSKTLHFGRAGDNLYVSQSTVSARIKQLEEQLGVTLFLRERNNIHLTQAGEKFLSYAENILTLWNRARFVVGVEDEGQLPLVIGALPSMWDIFVQKWLEGLFRQSVAHGYFAEVCDHNTIVRRVGEASMDVGFVFEAPQKVEIDVLEIMRVPLILVSREKNQQLEQALTNQYVYVDWGVAFANTHARHFADMPASRIRFTHGTLARNFVLECGGAAYLPEPMVRELIEREKLFPVMHAPVIERSAYALMPVKNTRNVVRDRMVRELSGYAVTGSRIV